jgi:Bacterial protein of unknown function (DUF839)
MVLSSFSRTGARSAFVCTGTPDQETIRLVVYQPRHVCAEAGDVRSNGIRGLANGMGLLSRRRINAFGGHIEVRQTNPGMRASNLLYRYTLLRHSSTARRLVGHFPSHFTSFPPACFTTALMETMMMTMLTNQVERPKTGSDDCSGDKTRAVVGAGQRSWKAIITVLAAWTACIAMLSSGSLWIRPDSPLSFVQRIALRRRGPAHPPHHQPPQEQQQRALQAADPCAITYRPGNLSVRQNSLRLSEGLSATIIAQSGQKVRYESGTRSNDRFHDQPDAAATYADTRSHNSGGWVYVSNSEVRPRSGNGSPGGVGAITFDRNGKVINYNMLLRNTKTNCGGGKTPWGAWISGEEHPNTGRIWQVDPFGNHAPVPITMGDTNKGLFESFAYDNRKENQPRFYMTKDHEAGALRRLYVCIFWFCCYMVLCCLPTLFWHLFLLLLVLLFPHRMFTFCHFPLRYSTPNKVQGVDPWELLTQPGQIEYLQLVPGSSGNSGTFRWTSNVETGNDSARDHFVRVLDCISSHGPPMLKGCFFCFSTLTHSLTRLHYLYYL